MSLAHVRHLAHGRRVSRRDRELHGAGGDTLVAGIIEYFSFPC